jgi:hypothetical protein
VIRARFFGHGDNTKIAVARWMIEDTRDDDGNANYAVALMLAQVTFWLAPDGRTGRVRAGHDHGEHVWLVRADDEWGDELGMSERSARRARHRLMKLGYIECRQFVDGGVKCTHIRRLPMAVDEVGDDAQTIRPETVDRKRPEPSDQKRPDAEDAETVQAGSRARASSSSKRELEGESSPTATAQSIVREWWDARVAAGSPPAQRFIAVQKVIEHALRNGVSEADLRWALPRCPTVSGGAIEMTLSQRRGRRGDAHQDALQREWDKARAEEGG